MRSRFLKLVLICVSFLILAGFSWAVDKDDIVAKVGNVQLTKFELGREFQQLLPLNSTFHSGVSAEKVETIKEEALDNLIERAYKVQYAIANEVAVPKEETDQLFEKIRSKFETEEDFKKALGRETVEELRASAYRMQLAKKAEDLVVNEKAAVSDEELRKFYEERKHMYKRPKRYRVSQVFVKVDPTLVGDDKVALMVRAEDLYERAMAGEDFYNLAYYNSDEPAKFVGGDIGYFHSGQIAEEIEEAIKDLKPGDIVGPVETLYGYHIVKLTEVEDPRQMEFDEVAGKIRSKIEGDRKAELYSAWMTELKKQYPVEVFLE